MITVSTQTNQMLHLRNWTLNDLVSIESEAQNNGNNRIRSKKHTLLTAKNSSNNLNNNQRQNSRFISTESARQIEEAFVERLKDRFEFQALSNNSFDHYTAEFIKCYDGKNLKAKLFISLIFHILNKITAKFLYFYIFDRRNIS